MYPGIAPLTLEEKAEIEQQIGAKQSFWVSSPLVARGLAGMFSNDPSVQVTHTMEHIVYGDGFSSGLSVTLRALSSSSMCINTAEIQDTWIQATGFKNKFKMSVSHKASARGLPEAICYLVHKNLGDDNAPARYAFFSERPHVVMIEDADTSSRASRDRYRLHCDDGPALVWGDARLWVIHGVEVDEQTVLRPDTLTFDDIFKKEKNEEARRVKMERYGMIRLMEHSTTIERRDNYVENTKEALVQLNRMRFLLCHCPSTGRMYALQVPAETKNCDAAQKWLWSGSSLDRDIKLNIIGRS